MIDLNGQPGSCESLQALCRWIFSFMCHQEGDSLVHCGGGVIPLCWRCAGLQIGCASAWITILLRRQAAGYAPSRAALPLVWASLAILAIHWLGGQVGLVPMNAAGRFLTGLLAGAGVGCILTGGPHRAILTTGRSFIVAVLAALMAGGVLVAADQWVIGVLVILVCVVANVLSVVIYGLSVVESPLHSRSQGAQP